MSPVRLYGKGAAVIQLEKEVIRAGAGFIDVPEPLVPHMLAQGWSQTPIPEDEPVDELHRLDAPDDVALTRGDAIDGDSESDESNDEAAAP